MFLIPLTLLDLGAAAKNYCQCNPYQKATTPQPSTRSKTGYYQLVIYVRVDQNYKVYNLPPIQTKISQTDYNPISIIVPCLIVGLVIGALGTSVMYVVNRKNVGFRL